MDSLQLYSVARCLEESFAGQMLRGTEVQQGVAVLYFPRGRLYLAYQHTPVGLFWADALAQVPKPAGSAAILGQKLRGFRLVSLELPWADRILRLRFAQTGLDRQEKSWSLLAECFGARAAILLLDDEERIHWASRWDTLEQDPARILPQASYQPPPKTQSWEDLPNLLLLLHPKQRERFGDGALEQIAALLQGPSCQPWWQGGVGAEPYPLRFDVGAVVIPIAEAVRWRAPVARVPRGQQTASAVGAREQEAQRLRRRQQRLWEDLAKWQDAQTEEARRYAAALFASPDRVHSGGILLLPEYRSDGVGEIELAIPAGKYLHAYAQELMRRAQRAERARQRIGDELARVDAALRRLPEQDIAPGIATGSSDKPRSRRPVGIEEREVDGFNILWGKNARANDYLSFRLGQPHDLWLHVQDLHGSHVLIRRQNPQQGVPAEVLRQAAEIALQHSASQSLSAEVDWTELRNVSRHPQGGAGRVLYRRFQTLRVRRPGSTRN